MSEAAAQFTTDVIGCCAFGLDLNSLSNPDSEFRRAGRDLLAPSRRMTVLNFIRKVGLGRLLNLFRIRRMPDNVYFFFDKLLNAAWEHHKTGENTRNDFIALLMKLKDEEKFMEPEQSNYIIYYTLIPIPPVYPVMLLNLKKFLFSLFIKFAKEFPKSFKKTVKQY